MGQPVCGGASQGVACISVPKVGLGIERLFFLCHVLGLKAFFTTKKQFKNYSRTVTCHSLVLMMHSIRTSWSQNFLTYGMAVSHILAARPLLQLVRILTIQPCCLARS